MKKLLKALLSFVLCASILLTLMPFGLADGDGKLKVGAAKVDITGPITDISTGYNSLGRCVSHKQKCRQLRLYRKFRRHIQL